MKKLKKRLILCRETLGVLTNRETQVAAGAAYKTIGRGSCFDECTAGDTCFTCNTCFTCIQQSCAPTCDSCLTCPY